MNEYVGDKASESAYRERLSSQLEALVNLRELHIGQSWYQNMDFLTFCPDLPKLPGLTRLVLHEYVCIDEFARLTHLATLRALSLNLGVHGWGAEPQDLVHSLTALSALRSVCIDHWRVEQPQDVSKLTQLTELKLRGCSGLVKALMPAVPMPNIISIALTEYFKAWRDIEFHSPDEQLEFARLVLRNAPTQFPNAQVMHLGTPSYCHWHSAGRPFSAVVTQVNGQVKQCLAAAPQLRYLQYDVLAMVDVQVVTWDLPMESVHVVMGEHAYDDASNGYGYDSDGDDGTLSVWKGDAHLGGSSVENEVRVWGRSVQRNTRVNMEGSDVYMAEICYSLT